MNEKAGLMHSRYQLRLAVVLCSVLCGALFVALAPLWDTALSNSTGVDSAGQDGAAHDGVAQRETSAWPPVAVKFSGAPDSSKGRILQKVRVQGHADAYHSPRRVEEPDVRSDHDQLIENLLEASNNFDGMLAAIGVAPDGKSINVELHERYKGTVSSSILREYEQYSPLPIKWSFARIEPVPLLIVEPE